MVKGSHYAPGVADRRAHAAESDSSISSIRLLFVDGHPITRWALGRMAQDHHDLVPIGEAGTAADALRLVATREPDVVTVGLALPDRDGLDLVRELRDRHGELGIVVFTSRGQDDVMFRALDTGASAFVAKTATTSEVLAAIRHAAASASSFSSRGLAAALRRRQQAGPALALSERERQVLALLVAGCSTPAIAAKLFISTSTAKTYVARVYDKLGTTNRAQAVLTALRLGLVHESAVIAGAADRS